MSRSSSPSVVAELVRIHLVITRGLKVASENSQSFAQRGYPDASTREGFVSYVRSLASSLHAHHLTEDDLAFPYFREKMPDAPFDLLSAHHRQMVPFLLYNLPPEKRAAFAQMLPPVVTQQLVPVVWKEKWEPMKPFLLP